MKTTQQAKDNFLAQPCEIEAELKEIFGEVGPARIADIGACDCLSSIKYMLLFPHADVIAFEPRSDNIAECVLNISIYKNKIDGNRIRLIKTALSDKISTNAAFYSSFGQAEWIKDNDTGNKSSSLLEPKEHIGVHKWCKFKQEQVCVATLDSCLVEPFFIERIDFIHIDVQGNELAVFRGGEVTLSKCRAVWCEVSNLELYKGQPLKREVVDYMVGRGFYILKDTCGTKAQGDILFVKVGKP